MLFRIELLLFVVPATLILLNDLQVNVRLSHRDISYAGSGVDDDPTSFGDNVDR